VGLYDGGSGSGWDTGPGLSAGESVEYGAQAYLSAVCGQCLEHSSPGRPRTVLRPLRPSEEQPGKDRRRIIGTCASVSHSRFQCCVLVGGWLAVCWIGIWIRWKQPGLSSILVGQRERVEDVDEPPYEDDNVSGQIHAVHQPENAPGSLGDKRGQRWNDRIAHAIIALLLRSDYVIASAA
jgi:hypothetical protein